MVIQVVLKKYMFGVLFIYYLFVFIFLFTSHVNLSTQNNNILAIMCLNETNYSNANWITIQSGQIQNGICNDNYYGSPTRQCFQNGSNNPIGIWNSTIINPCQRK